MKLPQLVFVAATVGGQEKVCLASCSPGIEDCLIAEVLPWVPERWQLAQRHSEATAFFPVNQEYFAISRSVRGKADSKGRGEKQLVTTVLLVRREQLVGYSGNPVVLTMIVQAHGGLMLPQRLVESVASFEVPDQSILEPVVADPETRARQAEQIARAMEIHGQVAVIGLNHPLGYLGEYLASLPKEQRLSLSWAIGLDVTKERRFDLQFFQGLDSAVQKDLVQLQVRTITLEEKTSLLVNVP